MSNGTIKPGRRISLVAMIMLGVLVLVLVLGVTGYRLLDGQRDDVSSPPAAIEDFSRGDSESAERALQQNSKVESNATIGFPANRDIARIAALSAKRKNLAAADAKNSQLARDSAIAAYRAERVDSAWANAHESKLVGMATSEAIASTGIEPRHSEISCKTRTCRIQADFATRSEAEDWVLMFMSSVGSELPDSVSSTRQNTDGSASVEIYGRAR